MTEPVSPPDTFLSPAESGGAIDEQTGLRPEELTFLTTHLTEPQKAEVVRALGGTWPEEQNSEASTEGEDLDTSEVGDIALDGTVVADTTEPTEDSLGTDSSPEKKSAIESIASNPAVSAGIDYWDNGAAYSVLKDYKFKRLSDETRDSEKLREDFNTLLLLTTTDINKLLPEQAKGYWAAVCKLENEDGVTYKLVMTSPKAANDRRSVDMMVSIPTVSDLQNEISLLDSDPSMLLDLFRALAKDEVGRHRESRGPFKLAEFADGVKAPFLLASEQTAAILDVINHKKKTYNLTDSHRVPPLNPTPRPAQDTSPKVERAVPAPARRRFGRRG